MAERPQAAGLRTEPRGVVGVAGGVKSLRMGAQLGVRTKRLHGGFCWDGEVGQSPSHGVEQAGRTCCGGMNADAVGAAGGGPDWRGLTAISWLEAVYGGYSGGLGAQLDTRDGEGDREVKGVGSGGSAMAGACCWAHGPLGMVTAILCSGPCAEELKPLAQAGLQVGRG